MLISWKNIDTWQMLWAHAIFGHTILAITQPFLCQFGWIFCGSSTDYYLSIIVRAFEIFRSPWRFVKTFVATIVTRVEIVRSIRYFKTKKFFQRNFSGLKTDFWDLQLSLGSTKLKQIENCHANFKLYSATKTTFSR